MVRWLLRYSLPVLGIPQARTKLLECVASIKQGFANMPSNKVLCWRAFISFIQDWTKGEVFPLCKVQSVFSQ